MGKRTASDAAAVMVAIRRIVRYLRLADREIEAACKLTAAQLFVLHALVDEPGMSFAELAARTLTDQSSVSTVVAKLVSRKLVSRKVSKRDRRRTELRLTAAGQRLVEQGPRLPQTQILMAIQAMPVRQRGALVRALESFVVAIGAKDVAPRMLFDDEPPIRRRR